MYWTEQGRGEIRRANLDGSSPEILVRNLDRPSGIALDLSNGQIYWADAGRGDIRRANLDGTQQQILLKGLSGPAVITLDLSFPGPPNIQTASRPEGPFTISWTALTGRGYQVQFKSDLPQTNWSNLVRLTATNVTMTAFDPVVSEPQRFYRILLLP